MIYSDLPPLMIRYVDERLADERTEGTIVVKEQRREKRVKEENRVLIEVAGRRQSEDEPAVNALTQDISLGGARIISTELFDVGTRLKMTLFLTKSRQVVKVQAEVRWSRTVESGVHEMGLQFEHGIPLSVMALINHLYKKEQRVPATVQAKPTPAEAH